MNNNMSNDLNGMSGGQPGSIANGLMNPNDVGGGNMRQPTEPQIDLNRYVEKTAF